MLVAARKAVDYGHTYINELVVAHLDNVTMPLRIDQGANHMKEGERSQTSVYPG
jgi:hypothetical protein